MYEFKDVHSYSKDLDVLYVEDDRNLVAETSAVFENFFKSVTVAYDGVEGLEAYKAFKAREHRYVDLVITDINMPHKNGMEMIDDIRAIHPEQAIIVVSAYSESERLVQLIHQGISNFILKPTTLKQMIQTFYQTCKNIDIAKQKEAFLLSQSRLASMGEMIDLIAHQWLQPINMMKMRMDLLEIEAKNKPLDLETVKEYNAQQTAQIKHLVETLREFRGFFRVSTDTVATSYKELIESVLFLLKDSIIYNTIEIVQDFEINPVIEVIPNEFKHVLINIINNAIDAFVDNKIKKRAMTFRSFIQDNYAVLELSDNAGGIPDGVIERVFESNFTTKGEGKGTGVGLHLSSLIVSKVGGSLEVFNRDEGAVFSIKLKLKKL